ncbi:MAG: MerC domain-containing protein [Phycisphaerales bacterium]
MATALEDQSPFHQAPDIGPSRAYRDWLGITASTLCAIHCAAMPFVVGFLPTLGLSFLADASFHKWMVGICLTLALLAFAPGWRRHRRSAPALVGLCGLTLISLAAFAGPDDCCPPPGTAPMVTVENPVQAAAPDGEAACTASCCPQPVVEAESAGVDSLLWMLMTPLGGVLLVVGHLHNRLWSCRCAAGCCARSVSEQIPV